MKEKHPLEYVASHLRAAENPYARMKENSLMISNFPKGVDVTKRYLRDLCMKFDRSAIINHIFIKEAELGDDLSVRNPVAYAIVEFEMPKWVASVKRGLRKHWEQEKLLKVKTLKDERAESHAERTIVMANLPSSMKADDIPDILSPFGAITSIEAPTIDSFVQSQLA